MSKISNEAEEILFEILEHESDLSHWKERFDKADTREDAILRGCFKELSENNLISAKWADNYPYIIQILKDGYLFQEHKKNESLLLMSDFERKLAELLERAKKLSPIKRITYDGENISESNMATNQWMDDVQIFHSRYLKKHPLSSRIDTLLFERNFNALVSALKSISSDVEFIDEVNGIVSANVPKYQANSLPEYDVFISHANKDKEELVEQLYQSLKKLGSGLKIFYDKETFEWGDNWKEKIYNGTKKSEFAIIVISENYFGREWTEKELGEFLSRQNRNGQKLILPIIHNISTEQLREKYPTVADIQAISSKDKTCDEIALLFAGQLIKRLKSS